MPAVATLPAKNEKLRIFFFRFTFDCSSFSVSVRDHFSDANLVNQDRTLDFCKGIASFSCASMIWFLSRNISVESGLLLSVLPQSFPKRIFSEKTKFGAVTLLRLRPVRDLFLSKQRGKQNLSNGFPPNPVSHLLADPSLLRSQRLNPTGRHQQLRL